MLGQDVVRAAERRRHEVVGARARRPRRDRRGGRRRASARAAPSVVINCAACTDVDGAEEHEDDALRVNGDGAGQRGRSGRRGRGGRLPLDRLRLRRLQARARTSSPTRPRPLSAYGRSKLAASTRPPRPTRATTSCARRGCSAPAARTSSRRCCALGARAATRCWWSRDQVGCPTYTGHLAEALVRLARRRGLRHPPHRRRRASAPGTSSRIEIFAQAGVDCASMPARRPSLPRPAPRPAYSRARHASATTRSACPTGATGLAATSPSGRSRA